MLQRLLTHVPSMEQVPISGMREQGSGSIGAAETSVQRDAFAQYPMSACAQSMTYRCAQRSFLLEVKLETSLEGTLQSQSLEACSCYAVGQI